MLALMRFGGYLQPAPSTTDPGNALAAAGRGFFNTTLKVSLRSPTASSLMRMLIDLFVSPG